MKRNIICFIGIDGAGKSSIICELKNKLENSHLKVDNIYFGWKPFLPTTKIISKILKKRDYKITNKMNNKINESQNFSLTQEIMLTYYLIEYLSRYLYQLKITSKGNIALVDRYFYDMYAHYHYANQSRIFPILLKIMPKPNLTILLDVDVEIAKQRKPEMDFALLKEHYNRYQDLSKIINVKIVKTNQDIENSVKEVMGLIKNKINHSIT